jgi:cytochrome c biogenesis protein
MAAPDRLAADVGHNGRVSMTERDAIGEVEDRIDHGDDGPTAEPRPGPSLGVAGWLRWGWRTLTSMRTALVLLLILVLAAIPGSVFPQRVSDELAVNEYVTNNPTTGPILDRLGMFDVFGSPWFAAVYLLLFVSLVGCVIPRTGQLFRQWRQGPSEPPRSFGSRRASATIPADDGTLDAAAVRLRSDGWRVSTGTGWVSAEKGFLREVGNLGFHLSMVALLVAVALGTFFGWRGNVVVAEGEGFANTLTQFDQWGGGLAVDPADLPPFAFTLQDFTVDFERGDSQRGAPRDFDATVLLQAEPGAAEQTVSLRVNDPIRMDGADVYLIGHGYAPRVKVTAPDGEVLFSDSVVFLPRDGNFTSNGVIKIPDADPPLAFTGIFAPTATVTEELGPHSLFPAPDVPGLFLSAFTGDLGLDDGVPRSVYQLDTSDLEQIGIEGLGPGQTWTLPDGTTVTFVSVERYVSLKISHDPGRIWALVAVGLVMAGLMLSLFVPRRRVWLRRFGDTVAVAGVARTENAAPAEDVARLVQELRRDTGHSEVVVEGADR